MDIITISDIASDKGIFIKPELLKDVLNKKVEITIKKVQKYNSNDILKFAGSINNELASEISRNIDECRTIDFGSW